MNTKLIATCLAAAALLGPQVPATRVRARTVTSGSRMRSRDEHEHTEIVPTRNEALVSVALKLYDSKTRVIEVCLALGAWEGQTVAQVAKVVDAPGCAAFDPNTKHCTIHNLTPKKVEDTARMENLGHELLHCFKGAYHSEPVH
jgi:hypothetical protein